LDFFTPYLGFLHPLSWISSPLILDFFTTYAYQKSSIYAAFRTPVIKRVIKKVIKRVIKLSIKGDGWIDFVIIEKPLILDFFTTYAYQKSSIYAAFRTPIIKKSGFYGDFSRKTPPITEPAAPPPRGNRRSGSAATRHRSMWKSVIKEKVIIH
jgi:hypothetical protein